MVRLPHQLSPYSLQWLDHRPLVPYSRNQQSPPSDFIGSLLFRCPRRLPAPNTHAKLAHGAPAASAVSIFTAMAGPQTTGSGLAKSAVVIVRLHLFSALPSPSSFSSWASTTRLAAMVHTDSRNRPSSTSDPARVQCHSSVPFISVGRTAANTGYNSAEPQCIGLRL
mgnify:CR=1 FL=1